MIEVEGEEERERGEEQAQTWEEFFASTSPTEVSPSFAKALGLRLTLLAGSVRSFVMRAIRWLRDGSKGKKGKKVVVAKCFFDGTMTEKDVREAEARRYSTCNIKTTTTSSTTTTTTSSTTSTSSTSSSSDAVDAARGRISSKGLWKQVASCFSSWVRKMRSVFL